MNLYVAEISGRAIAAMNAENMFIAEDWFGGPGFHSELPLLWDDDENPLWDGEAEIRVRLASSEEQETWEKGARRSSRGQRGFPATTLVAWSNRRRKPAPCQSAVQFRALTPLMIVDEPQFGASDRIIQIGGNRTVVDCLLIPPRRAPIGIPAS
jgi:hypothetical protein